MFVAGDQLLKGAALNAVQIAEVLVEQGGVHGPEQLDDCHEVRRDLRRIRRSHRSRRGNRSQPASHRKPVVVVSAMGKTTNKLLAIATRRWKWRRDEALD